MMQVMPKEKSIWSVVTYVVEKPQSLAIIFALVLLGMFIGVIPSNVSSTLASHDEKLTRILGEHAEMEKGRENQFKTLQSAVVEATGRSDAKTDQLIKIMRGMCLLQAQKSDANAALTYCNP